MNDETEVQDEPMDDLSAALAEAWDASEESDDGSGQDDSIPEPQMESNGVGEDSGTDGATESDNQGEFRPSAEKEGISPAVAQESQPAVDLATPPKGLSLEAREAWADVPDAVKSEIAKREQDYSNGIQQYAQNAQRAEAMDQTLAPYQQFFQVNGGAGQTIEGLLQTGSVLQMGTPQQKAQTVANIIKQFGIDVTALDGMLVGEAPSQEMQAQQHVQNMINQQLQPMQQQLQQYQQRELQEQQAAQAQIGGEIEQFASNPANEFYADVAPQMADLLDMAANRGQNMSLADAYQTACMTHPQISEIMKRRTDQAQVDQRKQAASSIHGTRGGTGGAQTGRSSIEQALNDAWDSQGVGGGRL